MKDVVPRANWGQAGPIQCGGGGGPGQARCKDGVWGHLKVFGGQGLLTDWNTGEFTEVGVDHKGRDLWAVLQVEVWHE